MVGGGVDPVEGVALAPTLEEAALAAVRLGGRPAEAARDPRADWVALRRGARALLRGHALQRGGGDPGRAALGVTSNAPAGRAPPSGGARGPRLPRPRRGGVHPRPAPPDDRPRGPGRAAAGEAADPRWASSCSTSSSATRATPTRPGRWRLPSARRSPSGPLPPWSLTSSAPRRTPRCAAARRRLWPRSARGWRRPTPRRPAWPPRSLVGMRIRLVTYSTKPRGGVVHALSLAEALGDRATRSICGRSRPTAPGSSARRRARAAGAGRAAARRGRRGADPALRRGAGGGAARGRPGRRPPRRGLPVGALAAGAARRGAHPGRSCGRSTTSTTSRARSLRECQRASIEDVDHRICVSRHWAAVLERDHGVGADVIPNGVDAARFAGCRLGRAEAGARPAGAPGRRSWRSAASSRARAAGRSWRPSRRPRAPWAGALLAIAGGETLFDYADYREAWEQTRPAGPARAEPGAAGRGRRRRAGPGRRRRDARPLPRRRRLRLPRPSARASGSWSSRPGSRPAGRGQRPAGAARVPLAGRGLPDGAAGRRRRARARAGRRGVRGPGRERLASAGPATAGRFTWERAAAAHEAVYEGLRVPA